MYPCTDTHSKADLGRVKDQKKNKIIKASVQPWKDHHAQ